MELLSILKNRFENNMHRHQGINWEDVERRINNPSTLKSLLYMEESGGEPDVIGLKDDKFIICDCSNESPKGRRSLCYDKEARISRKKLPPISSALEEIEKYGLSILDYEMYRKLQSIGEFDLSTSSWILAPKDIRDKGGALFMEKRYGHVFVFHNGADSYYSNRGFRAYLLV